LVEFPVASTRRTTIGPLTLLGRRGGIRRACSGPSRASFAAILHGGPRLDRRKRRELEDLIGHHRELLAEHLARLGTRTWSEKRARNEADDEEPK
jgi:hypothetical protein